MRFWRAGDTTRVIYLRRENAEGGNSRGRREARFGCTVSRLMYFPPPGPVGTVRKVTSVAGTIRRPHLGRPWRVPMRLQCAPYVSVVRKRPICRRLHRRESRAHGGTTFDLRAWSTGAGVITANAVSVNSRVCARVTANGETTVANEDGETTIFCFLLPFVFPRQRSAGRGGENRRRSRKRGRSVRISARTNDRI